MICTMGMPFFLPMTLQYPSPQFRTCPKNLFLIYSKARVSRVRLLLVGTQAIKATVKNRFPSFLQDDLKKGESQQGLEFEVPGIKRKCAQELGNECRKRLTMPGIQISLMLIIFARLPALNILTRDTKPTLRQPH